MGSASNNQVRRSIQPENAEYFRVAAKNSDFDRWGIKT
jgi:hypothetical protein